MMLVALAPNTLFPIFQGALRDLSPPPTSAVFRAALYALSYNEPFCVTAAQPADKSYIFLSRFATFANRQAA